MFGFLLTQTEPEAPPTRTGKLAAALRANAKHGTPVRMNPRDTTFDPDAEEDLGVLDAVKNIPSHY